jgi:hypothetical protein
MMQRHTPGHGEKPIKVREGANNHDILQGQSYVSVRAAKFTLTNSQSHKPRPWDLSEASPKGEVGLESVSTIVVVL